MDAVIIFLVACVLLYIFRLRSLDLFKRKAAAIPPSNGELFKANQTLVNTEVFFCVLVLMSMMLSFIVMDRWDDKYKTIENVLAFVFTGVVLLLCIPAIPIMQRSGSYLKWGEKEIEYNIAFENRSKDKKLIAIADISQIEECDLSFSLHLKSGDTLLIKKSLLKLLNGWEVLFGKFYELKKMLESV